MGHDAVHGSTKSEAGYLLPWEDSASSSDGVGLGIGACGGNVRAGLVVSQKAVLRGDLAVRSVQGLPSEVAYE